MVYPEASPAIPGFIVPDIGFRFLCDPRHESYAFYRVHPACSFAGKHYNIGTVEYGAGYIICGMKMFYGRSRLLPLLCLPVCSRQARGSGKTLSWQDKA